ncbi:MAG: 50S ribosomal protein L18 [candidate division WS2 bacterium]|nr:50S ribosomal protein L18 [Candidatus Lithacetigena glycinireducens]
MKKNDSRSVSRKIRHQRLRKKISGNIEKPRVAVFKSVKHIYAQAIDDDKRITLAFASSIDRELKEKLAESSKTEEAVLVGKLLAKRLLKLQVNKIVFDRGGFKYQGRIQALADAMREEGIIF